jgi:type II secretion system protein D
VINRLDSVEPREHVMVKLFQLQRATATELADILKKFLSGEEAASTKEEATGGGQPPLLVSYAYQSPEGEVKLRTLIRENVEIIPDERSNALIIVAPEDHMDMLENFIRDLDGLDPRRLEVQVFRLVNADAETLVTDVLEPLFEPPDTGGAQAGDEGQTEITLGGLGEGAGGRQYIAFTADTRTNTIIAAGTPDYLETAREIILGLDAEEIEERINRVVHLKYAQADTVRTAIDEFYDAERQRLEDLGEELAVQRLLEREVSIVADEDTQSVLVSVAPRYESDLMEMINRLDMPPPQVLIQVLIAQLSVDDRFEMGLEFAVQDLLFSETNVNGLGDNFDVVVGTDLGAAGSGTALGGFSFTITGEDFNFLLRMLQTEGRLEVLSAPQIMAQDNQEANISVGQEVPFVRNVQVTESGQVNNTVEYEDVGIIMDVTPHINPDGFVRLEIAPEISSLSPSTVQVSPGVSLPIIRKSSADTVVTVKEGESVVIGGLIRSSTEDSESKVPVVGDIPLLGNLFRATVNTSTKTELLIVVTPRVVRTVEDARRVSQEERDYPAIPDRVREHRLMRHLQAVPGQPRVQPPFEPLPLPQDSGGYGEPESAPYAPLPGEYGPPLPVSVGPAASYLPPVVQGQPGALEPADARTGPTQGYTLEVDLPGAMPPAVPVGDPDRVDAGVCAYLELRR